MKNKTSNENSAKSCKGKMETSKAKSNKRTEEKSQNSSDMKSKMENSDY